MTTQERFDERLAGWLREEARYRIPDHLDEVLVRTVATPQRSRWSSLERWLPMSTLLRDRVTIAPAFVWLVLSTAVLIALLGAALLAGAIRLPSEPMLGLATNGRLLVADGSRIKSYAADGTDPQTLATLPARAGAPWISPNGRFAATILDSLPRIDVIDIDDGSSTTIPLPASVQGIGGPVGWSADSSQLLFNAFDGSFEHLFVARSDGSDVRQVALDTEGVPGALARASDEHVELWPAGWSPTGDRIAFVAVEPGGGSQGSLYVSRPDGTEIERLKPVRVDTYSVSWSPDATVQRLLFSVMEGAGLSVGMVDVESGQITEVGQGFWPTWSPDGSRIAYWHDGTVVVDTAEALSGAAEPVPVTPEFTTNCEANPQLAGQSFCGPALWSPDGSRLYAVDITGTSVLSVMADGSGEPIVIPLETSTGATEFAANWQPIRP